MKKHIDHFNTKILNYDNYYTKLKNESDKFLEYRDQWDKASNFEVETSFPTQIEFELSNACNYRCVFCPYSFKKPDMPKNFDLPRHEKILNFELFKKIIDEGSKNKLMAIELGYNTEPLLYKKLINAINYAKEKGIVDIRMTSNGSKLNKNISKKLIEGGLTHIGVSLDAFSKEIYKVMRASKLYDQVKQNILDFIEIRKQLKKNVPTVRVSFLETEQNKHELKDFVNFWESKVDYVTIQSLIKYDNTPKKLLSESKNKKIEYTCHQPWQRLIIRSNGDIKPCCAIPGMAFNYPNANKISINEFWNGKIMKNMRKDLKVGEGYKNKICKSCIESVANKYN